MPNLWLALWIWKKNCILIFSSYGIVHLKIENCLYFISPPSYFKPVWLPYNDFHFMCVLKCKLSLTCYKEFCKFQKQLIILFQWIRGCCSQNRWMVAPKIAYTLLYSRRKTVRKQSSMSKCTVFIPRWPTISSGVRKCAFSEATGQNLWMAVKWYG